MINVQCTDLVHISLQPSIHIPSAYLVKGNSKPGRAVLHRSQTHVHVHLQANVEKKLVLWQQVCVNMPALQCIHDVSTMSSSISELFHTSITYESD